jgi:hypothetical protein
MAFKPIVVTKEIDGITYKAQYNGVSESYRMQDECDGKNMKIAAYLLENVIVEPRISPDEIDEYFGTNFEHMNAVMEFAQKVMQADKEYFPAPSKIGAKKEG